jgi:DNA-binding NtrC family response regulator
MPSREHDERALIVILEEEASQRQAIARYLDESGFAVIEAEDTDAARAVLEKRSDVHGLVTDAHVPGKIDGFELAGLVRKRWPAIAVVMMSGHSDASSGPVPEGGEFIAKPHLFSHLAPALERLIGRTA